MAAVINDTDNRSSSNSWSKSIKLFLKDLESRFPGMEDISLASPMGTPEAIMLDQYRRVAADVMPHFKR